MKRHLLCIILALALPCASWAATVVTAVATIAPEAASAAAAYAIPDGFWAGGTQAAPGSLLTIIHTGTGKSVVVTAVSFPLTDPKGRIFLSPRAASALGITADNEAQISIVAGVFPASLPAAGTATGTGSGTLDPDEDMSLLARTTPVQTPTVAVPSPLPAPGGAKPSPTVSTTMSTTLPSGAPPPSALVQGGTVQDAPVIPGTLKPASEQPTTAAPLRLGTGVFLPMNTGASSAGATTTATGGPDVLSAGQDPGVSSTPTTTVPASQKPLSPPIVSLTTKPGISPASTNLVFLQVGTFSTQTTLRKTMDYFMPFFPLEIRLVPGTGSARYRLLVGPLEPMQIEPARQRAREKGITDAFLTDQ